MSAVTNGSLNCPLYVILSAQNPIDHANVIISSNSLPYRDSLRIIKILCIDYSLVKAQSDANFSTKSGKILRIL